MAFPQSQLDVRVDLLVDGAWSDITDYTRVAEAVAIIRGRANEASRADPSSAALTLENRDGRFSPRNPTGALYGKIGRNTKMRVGIGLPPVAAVATTSVDSTSLVAPSVTAEAAGTLYCVWGAAPAGNITGPGGFSMGTERDGSLTTWAAGAKGVSSGATGTSTATHSVTATDQATVSIVVSGPSMSSSGFSLIETNRGAVSFDVTGITAGDYLLAAQGWSSDPDGRMTATPAIDGVPDPGWLLVADTGASSGPRIKAWICRVPPAGTATQSFKFAGFDSPGILPIASGGDNYARVWRITGATDYFPRHVGEVSEWPQRWNPAGTDVRAPVTSSGILRRLGQGSAPLRSSIARHIVSAADVVAYWPCEEAEGAAAFSSPIDGVDLATFRGTPIFAADDGFLCSEAIPTWQAAGFVGEVPDYTSTGELFAGALFSIPAAGMAADGANLLSVGFTGGTISRAILEYRTTGDLALKVYDRTSSTPVIDNAVNFDYNGDRFFAWIWLDTSGADVRGRINAIGLVDALGNQADYAPDPGQGAVQTAAAQTLGRARSVTAGIEGFNVSNGALSLTAAVSIGHVVVAKKAQAVFRSDFLHYYPALVGHFSEGAVERIIRLCREEGIDVLGSYDAPAAAGPYSVDSTALGPQRPGTLVELLQQAADADGGILYEPPGFLGLAYRPRSSRQNRGPDAVLAYAGGHIAEPFEPVDDDQATRNDVTVTRIGGSSARAELTAGALSTAAPPGGVGRYDESLSLSLWKDSQAADVAGWRLHLGTWDEARYPSVSTWLEKHAADIPTVAALDCAGRINLTGLPAWLPPGPAEIGVEGYSEVLTPFTWRMTFNASPAGPYRVPELDSTTYGRLDSTDTTTAEALDTTETGVDIAIASGSPLWITTASHPTEFPFTVTVGGEEMSVTACTTTGALTQAFTVTRSANGIVKSHLTGAQVRLAKPSYIAQGGDA